MIKPLEEYCNSIDCKSNKKILRSLGDIKTDHSDHNVKIKTFDELREELQQSDHPLMNFKKSQNKQLLDSFIDEEISKLTQSFEQVIIELRTQLKSFVSTNDQSFDNLVDLYNAIIDKNDSKIEELQYDIPKLSKSQNEIDEYNGIVSSFQQKIKRVFEEVKLEIQRVPERASFCIKPHGRNSYNLEYSLENQRYGQISQVNEMVAVIVQMAFIFFLFLYLMGYMKT